MKYLRSLVAVCIAPFLIVTMSRAEGPLRLLKDINTNGAQSSGPRGLVEAGGRLFFSALAPATGAELWTSDGTEEGTVLVKDIWPGVFSGSPRGLVALDGILIFSANDFGVTGRELWRSDGTESGTYLIEDLRPGPADFLSGDTFQREVCKFRGALFFPANDGAHGTELWKSDGTASGTVLVKDITPGSADSRPGGFIEVGDTLYFQAVNEEQRFEIWRTDGTEGGTGLVKGVDPGGMGGFGVLNAVGDVLFLNGNDGILGWELWKTDGSEEGTLLVRDLNPGPPSSSIKHSAPLAGALLFAADEGAQDNWELWRSDGTTDGTFLLKDIRPGPASSLDESFHPLGDWLLFRAKEDVHGREFWRSDGTETGTVLVKDIYPGVDSSNIHWLGTVYETLLFNASDSQSGPRLWRSDGTGPGTTKVQEISAMPEEHATIGRRIFMPASDAAHGQELWSGWTAIVVRQPERGVEDLMGEVRDLNLPQGIELSLIMKLEAARVALHRGDRRVSSLQLEAFAKALDAQVPRLVPLRAGTELGDFAQQIIDLLE